MAWRRRARSGAIWVLAGSVVALAVLVGLIQLALPLWASDPERVARMLSSRLGSPVRIDQALPTWSARGPLIELRGVQFGADGDTGARIERAAWAIDFAGLVRPGRVFSEFRVHGLEISLVRSGDGRWEVLGLPELLRGPERPLASVLQALPAFALRDSRLTVSYAPDRPSLRLRLPELRRVGADGSGSRWRGWLFPGDDADGPGLGLSLDMADDGSGRVHVAGEGLVLADWLGAVAPLGMRPVSGTLTVAAWLDLDRRGVSDVQLELGLVDSTWSSPDPLSAGPDAGAAAPTSLPDLRFGARIRRQGDGRTILVDELVMGEGAPGRLLGEVRDGDLVLHGQALDLAPLATLAMLADAVPAGVRRWLRDARPGGRIDRLTLAMADGELRQLGLDLAGLQASAVPGRDGGAGVPGVGGLSARISGDADGVALWPAAAAFVIDYPGVFAQPLPMHAEGGAVAAWRQDGGWQLAADQLHLVGADYAVRLEGGVLLRPDAPALLDLGALVLDSQVEAAKAFWPLNKIPNSARWLNRALKGGRIVEAQAWLRGPADGFPFKDGSGRLDARVRLAGAGLDYRPEWPELRAIDAELAFENARLVVASDRLQVGGLTVEGSRAELPDLKLPILTVTAQATAPGDRLLALIAATPLQARFGDYIKGMAIAGAPRVRLALTLPLKRELGETSVDGVVGFAGQGFSDSSWDLAFGDLDGELRFTRDAITVEDLALTLAGEPARLDLRIGAATTDPAAALQAQIDGRLSAAAVFGRVPALAPMLGAARGRAAWRVQVQVPEGGPGAGAAGAAPGWIRVDSDLRGIALDLPAPLAKDADATLPLHVDAATRVRARPIEVQLGQLLSMRAQLADDARPFAGTIALGGAGPEPMPARGLVISGQVPALDLSGWLALAGPGAGGDAGTGTDWPRVILRAGELGVFGRGFREVDLQMRPGADAVDVQLLGPDIEGSLQWPRAAAGRVVRGRFARLHVPAGGSSSVAGNLQPTAMPALDIEVEDARIGGTVFGRTVLQAQAAGDGYRIERFSSRNSAFDLDASGQWRLEAGGDVSEMAIRLRADDLGAMLESFGFAGLIQGGRTEAGIDGRWAGSPAAFALERIDGRLDVKVGAGRIVDIDPGVGRLFGLLNLREIPRRLVLDFRDIFSQGMRFNSIEGSFQLNVGDAYTDNVMLKSPAADILITGRTGLIMRDYDQTLEVTPRLGGALPVVGAIAAGPAGAAAGLVVQGLLRIDQSNRILYRVSGPWDRPDIDKQEPAAGPDRRQRSEPEPGQAGP
jgi:uncharacterized protein (TIGR02099 family)